jgi:hypothetical protein
MFTAALSEKLKTFHVYVIRAQHSGYLQRNKKITAMKEGESET